MIEFTFNSANIDSVLNGLDSVYRECPNVQFNLLEIYAKRVIRTAKGYFGTGGPASHPWEPLSKATVETKEHSRALIGGYRRGGYLGSPGDLKDGIKITSIGRGEAPHISVASTDWKTEIHEEGFTALKHKPFFGTVNIPARPFMLPAVLETDSDTSFWAMLTAFADESIEALAFDRRRRSVKMFDDFVERQSGGSKRSVNNKHRRKKRGE